MWPQKVCDFCSSKKKEGRHLFGLGGNQGDPVKISAYSVRNSRVYPIEYTFKEEDYE